MNKQANAHKLRCCCCFYMEESSSAWTSHVPEDMTISLTTKHKQDSISHVQQQQQDKYYDFGESTTFLHESSPYFESSSTFEDSMNDRYAGRAMSICSPPAPMRYAKHATATATIAIEALPEKILVERKIQESNNFSTTQHVTEQETTRVAGVLRRLSLEDVIVARGELGLFVAGTDAKAHRDMNRLSPERASRIVSILKELKKRPELFERLKLYEFPHLDSYQITPELLSTVHTKSYLNKLERLTSKAGDDHEANASAMDEFDSVYLTKKSWITAKEAASAAVSAVNSLLRLESPLAYAACAIRPPGHHAESYCAMGFCLCNNVALATKQALNEFGLTRILIVDFDVHHGNGTQRIFWEDERVLFLSVHRWDEGGFYPHSSPTDASELALGPPNTLAHGKTVNIAFNGGAAMGDAEYRHAWERVVEPLTHHFQPQLTIISAGFDAARGDQIGQYDVTPGCYAAMVSRLALHPTMGPNKCAMILEGGYNTDATARSFTECVQALADASEGKSTPWPSTENECNDNAKLSVSKTVACVAPLWPKGVFSSA